MLTPVGAAMLYRAFPQSERAKAATAVFGAAVIAPALGPVLGGLLVDILSWRWIFYVNIPLGVVTIVLAATLLVEHREAYAHRFDGKGFVLSGAAIATLLFGLSLGPTEGWTSPIIIGALISSPLLMASFIAVQRRSADPLLHLELFKDRMFRISNLAGTFLIGGYLGLIFLLPLFLQNLQGMSAFGSGLVLLPQSVGAFIGSQIAGRYWYRRYGPRPLMSIGALVAAGVGIAFLAVDTNTSPLISAAMLGVRGLAIGPVFIAMQTAAYATIPNDETGQAVAIFTTQRHVSSALGIAAGAAWLTARTPQASPTTGTLSAYHEAFILVSVLLAIGAVLSATIDNYDARSTMAQPKSESAH